MSSLSRDHRAAQLGDGRHLTEVSPSEFDSPIGAGFPLWVSCVLDYIHLPVVLFVPRGTCV
jgi:hypothetical protein